MTELRTGRRFPLQLPIKIEGEGLHAAIGETLNMSAAGAFITLDSDVEIGASVDFEVTLPAGAIGATQDVLVSCHGRVVRTEAAAADASGEEHQAGVAVVIDSYEFIRAAEKPDTK